MGVPGFEVIKRTACWGGVIVRLKYQSAALSGPTTLSVYLPPGVQEISAAQLEAPTFPALVWLSGLTCNDENFMIKSGAQQFAAREGLILICPDTSPRTANLGALESSSWSLGLGAGFYVDATQPPWSSHYRMQTFISRELVTTVAQLFPVDVHRVGISGHSMGGFGALQIGLRHPLTFKCVSAFSPIAHPSACPWGRTAFSTFLGADETAWEEYDPTHLVSLYTGADRHILIDQGGADEFLSSQLLPNYFLQAAEKAGAVDEQLSILCFVLMCTL